MKCNYCGSEILNDSTRCPNCSAEVTSTQVNNQEVNNIQSNEIETNTNIINNVSNTNVNPISKKKSNIGVVIIIIIAVIVLVIGGLYFALGNNKEPNTTTASTNIKYEDKELYTKYDIPSEFDGDSLKETINIGSFKVDIDTKNENIKINDKSISINNLGGTIYYLKKSDTLVMLIVYAESMEITAYNKSGELDLIDKEIDKNVDMDNINGNNLELTIRAWDQTSMYNGQKFVNICELKETEISEYEKYSVEAKYIIDMTSTEIKKENIKIDTIKTFKEMYESNKDICSNTEEPTNENLDENIKVTDKDLYKLYTVSVNENKDIISTIKVGTYEIKLTLNKNYENSSFNINNKKYDTLGNSLEFYYLKKSEVLIVIDAKDASYKIVSYNKNGEVELIDKKYAQEIREAKVSENSLELSIDAWEEYDLSVYDGEKYISICDTDINALNGKENNPVIATYSIDMKNTNINKIQPNVTKTVKNIIEDNKNGC